MDLNPTNALAGGPSQGQSSAARGALTSDVNTFLRMLTVQMQNQDPLNPMEASDFAVQLATFSGVEQQVRTNQLLDAITGQFGIMGMSQLAGWVGQEARAAVPVWYDGRPVTLSPNPAATADEAVLVVRDARGALVARENLPVSAEPYSWLGASADGSRLPTGRYSLSLESWRDGELLSETPMEYYGRVTEARGGAGGTRLVLSGGIEVAAGDITALRVPPD